MSARTLIFINLPVADLEAAKAFYSALGYTINLQFTDENASCVVVSDVIHVMLLTKPFFAGFTTRPLVDAHQATQVINCLSAQDRAAVDALVDKAVAAGGGEPMPPRDLGFMYQRSFQDLDGHLWEVVHMQGAPD